ncbi:HAMP domain-containing sensor histidine kinase [Nocardioides sp. BP30]|uniref:HAMP domain-containing sensor histidine kinase n=1 Tax=Nocardioides sp. BP30 TaxID=3036374 RepID=UPI0024687571|nr:HAMP domain-containing sensor histidine kinase [Nocardioides sp. BP30]WGL52735.1 HAMP domain-containing sensor histidine kinase [Nocardioides sp. BP30]
MTISHPTWLRGRSLAGRVTILTTLAVGMVVALIAIGGYVTVRAQLQRSFDDSLTQRAHTAAQALTDPMAGIRGVPNWVFGAGDVHLTIYTADGEVGTSQNDTTVIPKPGAAELAVARGSAAESLRTASAGGRTYRLVAVPLPGNRAALVVAQSLSAQEHVLRKLGLLMFSLGILGVIAAGLAGWGVANGGLRPVRRLTSDVERIARTEDLTPIPVEGHDEIARLAVSFNDMLIALAASRDRQKQLVADAGHELRTPLTSMRTNIDLLTQAGASLEPAQREELLDDVRAQMEELTTLIGDLVELARDEPLPPVVEPVELPEILDHAVTRVRRRAPSLTWQVDADPWWVVGEAPGLERAITNLLDNAAKWSPESGTVHVTLHGGVLTVDDEGPGIPDDDLPHVFDRFYRATESRSMPGSGLGLSIVRQVVERHAGTVSASRSPYGGARLTMRLPGSPAPAPRTQPVGVS